MYQEAYAIKERIKKKKRRLEVRLGQKKGKERPCDVPRSIRGRGKEDKGQE